MRGTTRGLGRVGFALILGLAGCTAVLGIDKEYEPETGSGGASSSASNGPGSGGGGGAVTSSGSVGGGGVGGGAGGIGGGSGGMGGGGAGGIGGAGGLGGAGGSGGSGGCETASDCPLPNICVTATCMNGTCDTVNVPQGSMPSMQIQGDCKTHTCTGLGTYETMDDVTDAADDMKECTTDTCVGGTTKHTNVSPGTPCSQNGGKVCNNAGACIECISGADCVAGSEICQSGKCVPPTCANVKKDGSETDIDCGGAACNPCGTNKICMMPSDCINNVCIGNKCQAADCMDTVKNGAETDVDCGGASCPDCASGKSCIGPGDCQSGVCTNGKCQAPSCLDTVKNGAETDIDCGGPACSPCANGQQCSMNSDCASGTCNAGVCG